MWSDPHRILERLLNSYKLETLEGHPLDREYHARRLHEFVPREGTELAAQQKERIVAVGMGELTEEAEEEIIGPGESGRSGVESEEGGGL